MRPYRPFSLTRLHEVRDGSNARFFRAATSISLPWLARHETGGGGQRGGHMARVHLAPWTFRVGSGVRPLRRRNMAKSHRHKPLLVNQLPLDGEQHPPAVGWRVLPPPPSSPRLSGGESGRERPPSLTRSMAHARFRRVAHTPTPSPDRPGASGPARARYMTHSCCPPMATVASR